MRDEDPRIVELRARREQARMGGGPERIAKQHAKGKLTARERIDLLLDRGSFQEIAPFVTSRDEDDSSSYGDGVVTGFGQVDGRQVYVYAQDFTVQGGALGEMHSQKICRVMDLAAKTGAPVVGLIDSGGARIQEGSRSLNGYGEIFRRNAQYSGIVPQISVILGPCAGGAAYSPALTDLIVMVDQTSYMFLTGPDVIRSVTGEEIDFENLGGAGVHLGISGLAHLTAPSEQEALALVRSVLGYLPSNNMENPPQREYSGPAADRDEALNSIIPADPSAAYSMREVIDRVVDPGSLIELQPTFARNAIVGLARIAGMPVGIVANEPAVVAGVMDIDSSDKITRFVRFCDAFNVPLVTFVDTPGFLPGVDQEHRGIIRHGAKVLYAYSEATVPKISVVTRKAYGGAYIVMSSRSLDGDLAFGWPSAEIAVMGPEGAVNILYRKQIAEAEDKAAERSRLVQEYRTNLLNPYRAASLGYLDDVIEPAETRARIVAGLKALRDKQVTPLPRKHGNMPV
ncbi:MAG TPA: acyl-CoA carboxylase subunit beta [Chloroflexi bacterium]|jgi:acetyl-CoA carboxylase carboxyltransferase component|nr:acyl-CoA carboxylase subunit beta [Chloroflexota bacterium]HPO58017.1 acyl-CoA carboxylase subunit beta [Anaerolineaceae bacterium]